MLYHLEIRNHFKTNKEKLFGKIKNGTWRSLDNNYFHILPKDQEILNLLEPYRNDLNQYLIENKKSLKKHIYFHHLNSSQAMCLNFFYPLLKEKSLENVLKLLGFDDEKINYDLVCFEKDSDIEKKHCRNYRPTSFDFFIETFSGKRFFFEIKYTEQEFGKAKADEIHVTKFTTVYEQNLNFINEDYRSSKIFLENYQILRNLICIDENSYVIFLYPEKNRKIRTRAESAKIKFLKPEISSNQINLTWESLLKHIESTDKNSDVLQQINNFRDKYNFQLENASH